MRRTFSLLLVLGLTTLVTRAQSPGPGGPEPDPDPDPTQVPIDGGASLLLAGGAAYGLRRLRARKAAQ